MMTFIKSLRSMPIIIFAIEQKTARGIRLMMRAVNFEKTLFALLMKEAKSTFVIYQGG